MTKSKFPISRREKWERIYKRSRYELLPLYTTEGKSQRDHEPTDVVDISPAGAALSRINRKVSQQPTTPDQVDTPKAIPFSWSDIFLTCFSAIFYVADIGTDCFVAYKHYLDIEEHPLYFGFTVAFVFLSGIVTSVFSLWWYYFEYHTKKENMPHELPSRSGLVVRVVASVFSFGPVVRYIDTIIYGMKSRKKGLSPQQRLYYYEQMQFERVDGAMLRLLEAFLESAPQFLLQVFIIFEKGLDGEKERNYFLVTVTIASITMSMLSLSWSVVAYHKALRMSRADLQTVSHFGLAFRFLWRLFEISPRVIILAMFMSAFSYYVAVFAAAHMLLMAIWLNLIRTNFCEKPVCEKFFVAVMALVWSFCFFNLKDGRTRKTSVVYYTLFYLENVGMVIGWHYKTINEDIWYRKIIIPIVLGSIVPMVVFMLIYYKFLHKQQIETCLPWSYWTTCRHVDLEENSRYNSKDGNGVERQRLTKNQSGLSAGDQPQSPTTPVKLGKAPTTPVKLGKAPTTPVKLGSQDSLGSDYIETNSDMLQPPTDMPTYRAPTPEPPRRVSVNSQHSEEKPNLDDFVEVNGYLVTPADMGNSNNRPQSKVLQRQDTMPEYQAPALPVDNYGATVPGGAPALFRYNSAVAAPSDPLHGSTLPGAPAAAAVLRNDKFVPYDEDGEEEEKENSSPPSLQPRLSTLITAADRSSHVDKPPLPQPRISTILHNDTADLTTVTELSADQSLFRDTLSPSPTPGETTTDQSSHDASINDITLTADSSIDISILGKDRSLLSGAGNVSVGSVDTPLKDSHILDKNIQLSPDTPIKDALRNSRNQQQHHESIVET